MKRVTCGTSVPTNNPFVVPESADTLIRFDVIGLATQPVSGDQREMGAYLTADLSSVYGDAAGGLKHQSVIAIANRGELNIPVISGERLLVSFEDAGSAILWFNSAE